MNVFGKTNQGLIQHVIDNVTNWGDQLFATGNLPYETQITLSFHEGFAPIVECSPAFESAQAPTLADTATKIAENDLEKGIKFLHFYFRETKDDPCIPPGYALILSFGPGVSITLG